tara:strand:- start:2302 stop:2952 length:651 start_codon:yes stop_codon:yes gene_type:complete
MKVKITIPSSLNDITLQQYKRYLKIQEKVKDERFLNAKMIEIFCNVDLKSVMHLQLKDSEEIVSIITGLFNSKPALIKRFKLNGVEYGFQPQLDELTLGEYIDLDTYIGDWENMEKAMNVLYRPVLVSVKDKYSIDEYRVGTESAIINMPMDAVMSSIFFLWNLGLDLSKNMTSYLEETQNETLIQFLNSQKNGVGINQFTDSLSEILEDLKISLN